MARRGKEPHTITPTLSAYIPGLRVFPFQFTPPLVGSACSAGPPSFTTALFHLPSNLRLLSSLDSSSSVRFSPPLAVGLLPFLPPPSPSAGDRLILPLKSLGILAQAFPCSCIHVFIPQVCAMDLCQEYRPALYNNTSQGFFMQGVGIIWSVTCCKCDKTCQAHKELMVKPLFFCPHRCWKLFGHSGRHTCLNPLHVSPALDRANSFG